MVPSLVKGPVEKCRSQLFETIEEEVQNRSAIFAHATTFKCSQDSTLTITELGAIRLLMSCAGLRDLLFSSIGLGIAQTPSQLISLLNCSLLALQAKEEGISVKEKVTGKIGLIGSLYFLSTGFLVSRMLTLIFYC